LALPGLSAAQAAATSQPAADATKVGTITVQFSVPDSPVGEQAVRANMRLREGLEFDPTALDRDVRSLMATGNFAQVDIRPTLRADRSAVDIIVRVTPKLRVATVRYEGHAKLGPTGFFSGGFARDLKTKAGSPLDEQQINADARAIREHYQKSGYNQAKVTYKIEPSAPGSRDAAGTAVVTFVITEGSRGIISAIRFTGNGHIKAKDLLKQMETTKRGLFSWLTGSGYLKDDMLEDDLDKLSRYYKEQGYLDVKLPARDKLGYDYSAPGKVALTIPIEEGRQYHVGRVTISGNKLISTPDLMRLIKQQTGAVFAPEKIDADVTALRDAFGTKGYLETNVRLVQPNPGSGTAIDIEYAIMEGELIHVESVQVEGNTKTKTLVIVRELNLGPGDVFDTVRMKAAKLTLDNTRFFDEVNVTDETTAVPGRRHLKIAVKEGQTGALNFGVGISSLERLVATAELTQGNFDLFNRRSLYQGAGQKFRLLLQLGTRSNQQLLSFEEPWAFQRRLAMGFSLYRVSTSYESSLYDEIRAGGQVYLRQVVLPRFGNRLVGFGDVEAQLSYTFESVTLNDVSPTAPAVILAAAGKQTVSKVGLTLSRDTRDRFINTTSGNRTELIAEVAGGLLGADSDYYRLEARASQFFLISETQTQVLGLVARLGSINNFGDSPQVPFFDRYFLGGPYTLRGFDYRDVGPKDPATGEPVGGRSYGLFSVEYTLDLVSPLRLALFYDAGFVNAGAYDFGTGNINSSYGFGLRLLLGGAPLNLDFGFPITGDRFNDRGMQFNFSAGARF
jgi:outer membrane protein insertion porin family